LKNLFFSSYVTEMLTIQKNECKICDYNILQKKLKNIVFYEYMDIFSNQKVGKSSTDNYYCSICDYYTSKKFNYDKHIFTAKHKKSTFSNQNVANVATHSCGCGKVYSDKSGLWRHQKKCKTNNDNQQLVEYFIKENSELKHMLLTSLQEQNKNIIEIAKNVGNNNNSHNTTNNNNQHFNLQFYLNNTCKNAMNIMDFVGQLQVGISDLEETGRLGFAEGISKIFINGLNQINANDRPIHCSDSKRETIYIKNNDEWTKESDNKILLTNAIKHVANKNIKQIFEWTKEHPEYNNPSSKENDKYLKIVN
jgi:hypothetical protein